MGWGNQKGGSSWTSNRSPGAFNPLFDKLLTAGAGGKGWGKGGGEQKSQFNVLKQNVPSTVWIGGVPEGVTFEEIKENFSAAGTVRRVQLTKNGTGFAWFSSPEEAQNAIRMFNGSIVNGSTLQVDVWTGKAVDSPSYGGGCGGGHWSQGGCGGGGGDGLAQLLAALTGGQANAAGNNQGKAQFKVLKQNAPSTVWIGGLPEGASFEEIKTNFSAAGTVKRVQLLKNGTGFAWFSSPEEAQKAIALFNGSTVGGSVIQVDAWEAKNKSA
mmetsp:Transcript_43391/g.102188  ORF Transcript_43391/g.102188 Transcript_43391/m.102188 type:complete len:269 (-) Transcript_43391:90-896(-)